jgi:glutamate/aspartate transport system substrate-binding protein
MLRFPFILLAILLSYALPGIAGTELRTAAQDNSAPKFVRHDSKVEGFCIDILRAIEREDPELKFVGDQSSLPPRRIVAMLKSGNLDLACGMTRSDETERQLHVLRPALFGVTYLLAARVDDDVQIQNWDDVVKLGKNGVVLGVTGMSILHQIEEQHHLIVVASDASSVEANLHMLVAKRGRFFFYREPGLKKAIRDSGLSNSIKVLPTVMIATDLYLVARKDLPTETAERLQNALRSLRQSGELDKILARWSD